MPLIVDYPDSLPDALHQSRAQFEQEARMALAVKLFETKRVSSGIAAQMAGVPRAVFLLGLQQHGVPMIDLTAEELDSDLAHA